MPHGVKTHLLSGIAEHKLTLKQKSHNLILAVSYQGYNKLQYTYYTKFVLHLKEILGPSDNISCRCRSTSIAFK